MPLPSNLNWTDRIALGGGKAYFLCQKKREHPSGGKVLRTFKFKRDAETFRAAHDTAYHGRLLSHLGVRPHEPLYARPLCAEWLAHQTHLVERGRRDKQTLEHYEYICYI